MAGGSPPLNIQNFFYPLTAFFFDFDLDRDGEGAMLPAKCLRQSCRNF
jgi:hypothetical protein